MEYIFRDSIGPTAPITLAVVLVLTARGYCEAVKESKSVEMIGGDELNTL